MIKHILNYAPAKLIPGVVNFLGLMIYARIFLKEEYGRYAYVMAIISIFQSIFYPWIKLSLLRYYQKYSKNKQNDKYVQGEMDEGEGNCLWGTPEAQLCLQTNLDVCKSYSFLLWLLET